jgi:DNA-binding NtrC family response regulator
MKQQSPKARILIVDDSADICLLLTSHLKLRGFSADSTQNGSNALKMIARERYEIVICDIIMPGMKGTELLQKIKKSYPVTHVIMITGYVSLEHLITCMKYGADTCIFKPMANFTELDGAIEMALDALRRWEEKIVALKGLKEQYTQSFELENEEEPEKDQIEAETVS